MILQMQQAEYYTWSHLLLYFPAWASIEAEARSQSSYGMASSSRLLKIISLFCKRDLRKRPYSAKETYHFKEPTNRSHPIDLFSLKRGKRDLRTVASSFAKSSGKFHWWWDRLYLMTSAYSAVSHHHSLQNEQQQHRRHAFALLLQRGPV